MLMASDQTNLYERQRQPWHVGHKQQHDEHGDEKRKGVPEHLRQRRAEPVGGKNKSRPTGGVKYPSCMLSKRSCRDAGDRCRIPG